MLQGNIQSELFVELCNKQQQFVAGGGPTLGIVSDATEYVANTAPTTSTAGASPIGATSNGAALPGEIDSYGGQTSLGASGVPGLAIPAALTFPSIAGPRTAALTQPAQRSTGLGLPAIPGVGPLPGLPAV
jgi:hypothetical protein